MIRVNRLAATPNYLLKQGAAAAAAVLAAYQANEPAYRSGQATLKFGDAYGKPQVKSVLMAAQHNKCCFCEGNSMAYAPGDVDHYRPKAFIQDSRGKPKIYPGYYWLAYCWSNLLFICQNCNRSNKRNYFPLVNESDRARTPAHDLTAEELLVIDAAGIDDPRDHIQFVGALVRGRSPKGRSTIIVAGLDRDELREERAKKLNELELMVKIVKIYQTTNNVELQEIADRAEQVLRDAVLPSASFSSMALDLLNPRPLI